MKTLPDAQRAMLTEEVLAEQREMLVRQILPGAIDTKLAYLDFQRAMPAENIPKVMDQLNKQFDEQELPKAMEEAEARTPADLDVILRQLGSSLEKERRMYAERLVAQAMIGRNVDREQEVTHEQMLAYYNQHLDDYRYEPKVRWEQLCALVANHPNPTAAQRAVAQMGNEVLRGAAFEAVARNRSQGLTARDGGKFDWTEKGKLGSKTLDDALFSLPVGQLSEILSDASGYHIVRVIERQEAGVVPFADVQKKIEETIRKERVEKQAEAYLNRLRQATPIWTAYDDQPPAGAATMR
jgi:parvulin-like peptidyl-prolyl isomerase